MGRQHIVTFQAKHPTSRVALNRWYKLVSGMVCNKPQDVHQLFGRRVDFVGRQVVFDVGGNKIRLISKIDFSVNTVLVTHVLTHSQYDKQKWRE